MTAKTHSLLLRLVVGMALITDFAASATAHLSGYPPTRYDEPYRGQFHFSSQGGWLNDANGMWYADGVYHLAYQQYGYGLTGGPRSWGVATSPDMMHWTQKPWMLDPNVVPGDCWSGSTVIDENDTSGLKTGANPVWVSIYTATSKGTCLAYSNDLGATWQPYAGNPVDVGGPNSDTRDPHVFWYAPTGRWVCLLFENGISFYSSPDLKNWTKESHIDFGHECPDMYELPIDGDASRMKWVVQDASGAYLVGGFDGSVFTPDPGGPYKMDVGPGFYASQTFNRASFPDSRVVQIAWNVAWDNLPYTQPWAQNMTFPAEIKLKTFPEGVRVARLPIAEISRLWSGARHYKAQTMLAGQNLLLDRSAECCDIEAVFDLTATAANIITFQLGNRTFTYDVAGRTLLGKSLSPVDNKVKIRILRDWSQLEVFANDGEFSYSERFAFTPGDGSVSLRADGSVNLVSADFRDVKRTWPGKAGRPTQTIDDADPATFYSGDWKTDDSQFYYKSTCHYSSDTGAYVETRFIGPRIDWWGLANVDLGLADVYIDGVRVAAGIDCYGPVRSLNRLFSTNSLSKESHTIKVVVTGMKNRASAGSALVHDYFVVDR